MVPRIYRIDAIRHAFLESRGKAGLGQIVSIDKLWLDFYRSLTGSDYISFTKCAAEDCEVMIGIYDGTVGRPPKYCSDRCRYRISQRKYRTKHRE
jgi:hypothetical protein